MSTMNTWLPGQPTYTFGSGCTLALATADVGGSAMGTVQRATIANDASGFGTVHDMISPPWAITKPPKIGYRSDRNMMLIVKDADGWLWAAAMRAHTTFAERGWSWDKFSTHAIQENEGEPPETPAEGNILAFQIQGASGITYPATVDIAYISARSPVPAASGQIRKGRITITEPGAISFKVGDVGLVNGGRLPIRYLGAAPFGIQIDGPSRTGRAPLPYRGPMIAGYQSGTPWVDLDEPEKITGLLAMMKEAQEQFAARHPQGLLGPFMHCYLPATWDSIQSGGIDRWVWDAPDGNPTWTGWQWRAFDGVAATWAACKEVGMTSQASDALVVATRFLNWLHGWLATRPEVNYLPSAWGPPGWTPGTPLPPDSYLDPHGASLEPHDVALAMRGALRCFLAGGEVAKCKEVVRRCVRMLSSCQVNVAESPMRGCFTLDPDNFVAYGFQQGEIHDALAQVVLHPQVLA